MYKTDKGKLRRNSYKKHSKKKKTLHLKCNAGNSGNVNLWLFTVHFM